MNIICFPDSHFIVVWFEFGRRVGADEKTHDRRQPWVWFEGFSSSTTTHGGVADYGDCHEQVEADQIHA